MPIAASWSGLVEVGNVLERIGVLQKTETYHLRSQRSDEVRAPLAEPAVFLPGCIGIRSIKRPRWSVRCQAIWRQTVKRLGNSRWTAPETT